MNLDGVTGPQCVNEHNLDWVSYEYCNLHIHTEWTMGVHVEDVV